MTTTLKLQDRVKIDVIIPSNKRTQSYTRQSLKQLESLSYHDINILVVNDFDVEGEWGYNKALNLGYSLSDADYLFFANNDLKYSKHWDYHLVRALQYYDSVSPYCPDSYDSDINEEIELGYRVGKELAGWAIMTKRETMEKINGFDEDFSFWCCDDSYAEQLKQNDLIHGLIKKSIVQHYGSKTLNSIRDRSIKNDLTLIQVRKFNKKYKKNLFNLGV